MARLGIHTKATNKTKTPRMARLGIQTKATDKTKNKIIPTKRGDDNHQGK